jgi:dCTP deaminase
VKSAIQGQAPQEEQSRHESHARGYGRPGGGVGEHPVKGIGTRLEQLWRRRRLSREPAMSVLADHQILAAMRASELIVQPFDATMIRPAALSLRLGSDAVVLDAAQPVDARDRATYPQLRARKPDEQGRLTVNPGEVLLVPTLERIALSNRLTGILDGISDVARLGLSVVLSQQVSPGFGWPDGGVLTLEIWSRLQMPIVMYPGTRICNLMLMRCGGAAKSYPLMLHNHSADTGAAPSNWAAFHQQPHITR